MRPDTRQIGVLRAIVKINGETPAQKNKRREIMGYLTNQLCDLELVGEVKTVLTFNHNKKKICCYGHWIPDYAFFARLQPTIGVTAIAYPHFHQLTKWHQGYFVPLHTFEPQYEDQWVALINFVIAPFEPATPFPRLRPVA